MSRMIRLALALTLALVTGLLAPPPAQAAATNTVIVHATDPDGAPVGITLWKYMGGNGAGNSSATGNLTWAGIEDGDFDFAVQATSMDDYQQWYDGTAAGSATRPATPTHLSGGQTLTINLQFPRLATLSGTVLGSDSSPVANLAVIINRAGTVKSVHTDAAGHYTFGYLRPGAISISTGGNANWAHAPEQIITVPTSGAAIKDFTLTKTGTMEGTLTNAADDLPLANISINAYTRIGAAMSYAASTTTDALGHYKLTGLSEADHILQFGDTLGGGIRTSWYSGDADTPETATVIAVKAGLVTTHDEKLNYPDPSANQHTLSGTVTDPHGAPLPGISVTATAGADSVQTTTNRNGRWALLTPDGAWTVRAESGPVLQQAENWATPWHPQYYATTGTSDTPTSATTAMVATQAAVDSLDISLTRAARVRFDVRAATNPGGDTLTPSWRAFSTAGAELAPPPTDANGWPLFRPGSYKVLITAELNGGVLLPRWYTAGTSSDTATPVTLTSGQDLDATSSPVTLSDALAATSAPTISGTPTLGSTLTGGTGSWNLHTGTTFAVSWKRGATEVGTNTTYLVTPADAGATLTYTVTATNGVYGKVFVATSSRSAFIAVTPTNPPTSPSTTTVAKAASKTSLKASSLKRKKVRFTIAVGSTGAVAQGTVTITRGSVVVAKVKLVKGKATIKVSRQPRGHQTYRATFNGSPQVLKSISAKVRLRVR
jgi:hypothetical protein